MPVTVIVTLISSSQNAAVVSAVLVDGNDRPAIAKMEWTCQKWWPFVLELSAIVMILIVGLTYQWHISHLIVILIHLWALNVRIWKSHCALVEYLNAITTGICTKWRKESRAPLWSKEHNKNRKYNHIRWKKTCRKNALYYCRIWPFRPGWSMGSAFSWLLSLSWKYGYNKYDG